jgi:hypothetical protein
MTARAEYRPVTTALLTEAGYQRLTAPARLTVLTLKVMLPGVGIATVPALPHALAELTGLEVAAVEAALAEVEAGGWIQRDGGTVWLVEGLAGEPSWSAASPLTRRGVQKHLAGIASGKLRAAFQERYQEFSESSPLKGPSIPPSKGASEAPSKEVGAAAAAVEGVVVGVGVQGEGKLPANLAAVIPTEYHTDVVEAVTGRPVALRVVEQLLAEGAPGEAVGEAIRTAIGFGKPVTLRLLKKLIVAGRQEIRDPSESPGQRVYKMAERSGGEPALNGSSP